MVALFCLLAGVGSASAQSDKKKGDSKKKNEPFKIQRLTQGMGLYSLGSVSPDRRHILLLAKKPERAPNLYIMDVQDFSIRPPLTDFPWGVANPAWSPDGTLVAFAAFNETATFSEIFTLELKTGRQRRMTSNSFSDKEPVFSPDGKRIIYTTDESPLPDAAFGILHVASIPVTGGKHEAFTEDEGSSIQPGVTADNKSVLLVKVDEYSGRHSLWQYDFNGKPQRGLSGRRFARIHRYFVSTDGSFITLWAQQEPEQQDGVFVLDMKTLEIKPLPDDDLPKRNPAVSPDGRRIAFVSLLDDALHLFIYDSGTGQNQQVTFKGGSNHSPVFITNEKILFGSNRDIDSEIYLLDLSAPVEEEKKKK
ncbi:MAG TPA: hypothetical protein VLD57_06215 [Blastocatellia bacterium]|nr:hypothetical protein [Blastocatellia bacterium]